MIKNVIPVKLVLEVFNRGTGNPESVPRIPWSGLIDKYWAGSAKARNQLGIGFLSLRLETEFSQETLDSCLRRNDDPGRAGWHKLFIGITH